MDKFIRRICRNIITCLLLAAMVTTTVAPTSNSDAYPTPDNNPSLVTAAETSIYSKPKTETVTVTEPVETTAPATEPTETVQPETTAPVETAPETIPETEPMTEPTEPELIMYFDENDVLALARTLYKECRGVKSKTRQACVAWTACNRVGKFDWGDTIIEVLTYPNAFAHSWSAPVTDELYDLALDVLTRWNLERNGYTDVGRVMPEDFLYFHGDGRENYFRRYYENDYVYWDYSLPSPYEN